MPLENTQEPDPQFRGKEFAAEHPTSTAVLLEPKAELSCVIYSPYEVPAVNLAWQRDSLRHKCPQPAAWLSAQFSLLK